MPWVRIDDHFDEHPKLARVGPVGWGIWLAGLAYCNRNLTDGFIPRSVARSLGDFEVVGSDGEVFHLAVTRGMAGTDLDAQWVIDLLVEAGLWVVEPGGYRVHDFGDFQPTKAEVLAEREQKRAAGRAGGKASAQARAQARAQAGASPPAQAAAEAPAQADAQAESKPVPVPVPLPPTEEEAAARAHATVTGLHPRLAEVVQILQACQSPDGRGLLVEPASINSMILAHPDRDPVKAAHKTAAIVQAGNNRTSNATSLFGSVIGAMKPEPADQAPARDERRARRHAAMQRLMNSSTEGAS